MSWILAMTMWALQTSRFYAHRGGMFALVQPCARVSNRPYHPTRTNTISNHRRCTTSLSSEFGRRWRTYHWTTSRAFSTQLRATTTNNNNNNNNKGRAANAASRWQVGDLVTYTDSSGTIQNGTIVEHRGSGWYTLQPSALAENGNSDGTVKIRGTLLQAIDRSSSKILSYDSTYLSNPTVLPTPKHSPKDQMEGLSVPPPPTIVDLDAALQHSTIGIDDGTTNLEDPILNQYDQEYLEQVANHASIPKWVVFTDLHCAPSTLETSLQVLDRVHQLAVERSAGVLFLGDFWHHRGTLRVDCLNAVLEHLRNWTVPMVLIPGNHDQVTLGGHSHGLTALENAYRVPYHNKTTQDMKKSPSLPGPLVFSYPTKFAKALFVPHIRDHAIMESVLQSSIAQRDASAIFVHADVTGAYMNDMIVSMGGVPTSMFPPHKPIYSGHFHKPHVVKAAAGQTIEYLGSPYQTSLAEAHQEKYLAVLDSTKGWTCIEKIPICLGRKHFRLSSVEEFVSLGSSSDDVRSGDRVVLYLNSRDFSDLRIGDKSKEGDSPLSEQISKLRKKGAVVEVREAVDETNAEVSRTQYNESAEIDCLSPQSTWSIYLEEQVRRGTMSSNASEAILEAGLNILEEVETSIEEPLPEFGETISNLDLTSVTVEGFGPFVGAITYPLSDRGLVLLRGQNRDGGSDRCVYCMICDLFVFG